MNKEDLQRIRYIKMYCEEIQDFIERFGDDYFFLQQIGHI